MRENYFKGNINLRDYIRDTTCSSGSTLSLVEHRPEDYGKYLAGKLDEAPTAAMGRGSYFHGRSTEPNDIKENFAFYPNRNEATREETREEVGPRGGVKKVKTGKFIPQDATPMGARLRMLMSLGQHSKDQLSAFNRTVRGRAVVYPEDQPLVEAMIRAMWKHEKAAELLKPDSGFAPEVTGYYTCPVTGERLRIRPDGLREAARQWIEIKTVMPRTGSRLDTLNSGQIMSFLRKGWARKSAMLHDGCSAITGDKWVGWWIVVEATEDDPRVSVIEDHDETDGSISSLGRVGDGPDGELSGYLDLIRKAQRMRGSNDFRHECVRRVLPRWELPEYLLTRMMFAANANPAPLVKGARVVTDGT